MSAVLSFPTHLTRPPHSSGGLLDQATWDRCFLQANVADQFRDFEHELADATVLAMIADLGADALARVLEQNAAAIGALRAMLASFVEADRCLAAAADRVLQARGA